MKQRLTLWILRKLSDPVGIWILNSEYGEEFHLGDWHINSSYGCGI